MIHTHACFWFTSDTLVYGVPGGFGTGDGLGGGGEFDKGWRFDLTLVIHKSVVSDTIHLT